jgi:protein O-GlcNAc transferase
MTCHFVKVRQAYNFVMFSSASVRRRALWALFFFSLFLRNQRAAAQTTSAPELQQATAAFRSGSVAFHAGDLAGAQSHFETAVRLAPQVSAAHAALGAVLLARGHAVAAVRELKRAHELDPASRVAELNLAVAESQAQDFSAAAAEYKLLLQASPSADDVTDKNAAFPLARALSATGDPAGAAALLARAVAIAPDDASLQDALGTMQAATGAYPEAEATLRKAVALNPALTAPHLHLGAVLLVENRASDAAAELRTARRLEPGNAACLLELARALQAQNPHAEAQDAEVIDVLKTGVKLAAPDTAGGIEIRYQLALALQIQERFKEALPLFDDVVAARPKDANALTNAGLDHVQLGDAAAGTALYLRALKLNPSSATLREDLGVAYLQQNDLTHAMEQFRAGLTLDDQSPQLHYDLGLALKLKDDLAAAIPEFERAAVLDPALPDPPYTLGVIYMQQGRFADAAQRLERATELRPDNGDAWATLGSVYRQSGQFEKAIPALRRAIALLPLQPSPHLTLASILAQQGHKQEAAAERTLGADLTRRAVNRQKADFGIDSGNLLLKRGQTGEALVQFQNAVDADPGYAAAHLALAGGLEQAGRKAEAAEERQHADTLRVPHDPP